MLCCIAFFCVSVPVLADTASDTASSGRLRCDPECSAAEDSIPSGLFAGTSGCRVRLPAHATV